MYTEIDKSNMLSTISLKNLQQKKKKQKTKSLDEADTANLDISGWYMGVLYYSHYFCAYHILKYP